MSDFKIISIVLNLGKLFWYHKSMEINVELYISVEGGAQRGNYVSYRSVSALRSREPKSYGEATSEEEIIAFIFEL